MSHPLSEADRQRLFAALEAEAPEMLALLERIVSIDSNSHDKAGVDRVGEALADWLGARGITMTRRPLPDHGDGFFAEIPPSSGDNGGPVLLMGHRDTVFPTGEVARRPFTTRERRAYGPGVADMKGGLVLNVVVAATLHRLGLPHPGIRLLMTGDEEIATPASRQIIRDAATGARAVFNAEPGRVSGNVVIARRGGMFFRVTIHGRASHAGLNPRDGRSAILALARKITDWSAMSSAERDLDVNVGLISGGQAVNMVAPKAECQIDLRYGDPALRETFLGEIRAIAERSDVPDTTAEVEILGEFAPMPESAEQAKLLDLYIRSAAESGLTLAGERTPSCADSGITAAMGVPTICATGPVGGGAHSESEYLEIDSIVPRAKSLALAITGLATTGLAG